MEMGQKIYDAMMKLPILLFTGYFVRREYHGLLEFVGNHPYLYHADFSSKLQFLARISLLLFLVIMMLFHLIRRHPVKKFSIFLPKLIALLALNFNLLLMFLPHANPDPLIDGVSIVLITLGNYFCMIALMSLGRSLSIMPEARKLVTDGVYRYVRHPLYLAEEIATIGMFLQFRSVWAALIVLAHLALQIRRMKWEEQILTETFPEYGTYSRGTYRLIPYVY